MYPLGALAESGVADEIVIDTDVPERFDGIAASVPIHIDLRDESVQGDDVSMNAVLATIVERRPADRFVQLHASNPFITPATIRRAVGMLGSNGCPMRCDSVYTVTEHRARFYDKDLRPLNHDPDNLIPTQRLAPMYSENSTLYAFTGEAMRIYGQRIGAAPRLLPIPPIEAIDIDEPGDWDLAELVALGKKAVLQKGLDPFAIV
jgi:CMP-N-acetylneuraminic acid synthetase